MKTRLNILMLIVSVWIISCKDTESPAPIKNFYEYYPLSTGNYIIYDVDSTNFGITDTRYSYEMKDLVADTFYDGENRLNYRIERYHRKSSPLPWELREVWSAIPSEKKLITLEQNMSFIRLLFPVNIDQVWNLNAMNYLPSEMVNYTNIHKSFKSGTIFVDSSVTVIEKADTTNLVMNEFQKRVYGLHTGLVYYYKDSLQLEFHPQRKGDTTGGYMIEYKIKEINY